MPMPITGEYKITFYDSKKKRVKQHTCFKNCLISSKKRGYELLKEYSNLCSFSVDRRIFNNLEDGP